MINKYHCNVITKIMYNNRSISVKGGVKESRVLKSVSGQPTWLPTSLSESP